MESNNEISSKGKTSNFINMMNQNRKFLPNYIKILNINDINEHDKQFFLAFFMESKSPYLFCELPNHKCLNPLGSAEILLESLSVEGNNSLLPNHNKTKSIRSASHYHGTNHKCLVNYPNSCFGCDKYDEGEEITWNLINHTINIENIEIPISHGQFFCKRCILFINDMEYWGSEFVNDTNEIINCTYRNSNTNEEIEYESKPVELNCALEFIKKIRKSTINL